MNEILKAWMNPALLEEMDEGVLNAPQDLLGMHMYEGTQLFIVRRPGAQAVWITDTAGESATEAEELDAELGLFGVEITKKKNQLKDYRVRVQYSSEDIIEIVDPYQFEPVMTDFDCYIFGEGKNYKIFDKFGAHIETRNGVTGTRFAVWAPDARSVSVVGSFNMWDGRLHTMRLLGPTGVYELFVPGVTEGGIYKYQITTRSGELLYKTDPYGNYAEVRPGNASVVTSLEGYEWGDADYMKSHEEKTREVRERSPMNIYEVHLGSWKKRIEDDDNGFYSYRELAGMLGDYMQEMGYTHIELMGIAEYPFDGSWGYQVGCYYAPTSRYGTPKDFMYFVDEMHRRGIEVILDWVPAHFPKDAHCLGNFDGKAVYEHPDRRRGEHPDWGTYIFDYGRREVQNFLVANALFWVEKFHIDGLRVDAVASMLYLDYGKQDGDWLPNRDGGNENYEAVEFLRHLNGVMEELHPGAYIVAEESTAWPGVTSAVDAQGLGFSFKWNMGWMNDFLNYIKLDPLYRKYHHNQLTFSMVYEYSEKFMLVLSHDEVVHEKGSMISKMPGGYEDKFSNLRVAYGYMMTHPGKKLLFMGQEIAQFAEFNEGQEVDWSLFEFDAHVFMQGYVKELNYLYQTEPALYELDGNPDGFEWINCNSANTSLLSFIRRGKKETDTLVVICNFTPIEHKAYKLGVPSGGKWQEIFSSDSSKYGGEGRNNKVAKQAKKEECDGQEHYISVNVPPLSIAVFKKKIGK